jgi:hypothetical protein
MLHKLPGQPIMVCYMGKPPAVSRVAHTAMRHIHANYSLQYLQSNRPGWWGEGANIDWRTYDLRGASKVRPCSHIIKNLENAETRGRRCECEKELRRTVDTRTAELCIHRMPRSHGYCQKLRSHRPSVQSCFLRGSKRKGTLNDKQPS